ncbi:MAG: lamin tail domain-containing protein [Acidobacteria bacterium]|nr:lamin tail domain-containing protein [Acidobacteriota bacterium]
MRKGFLALAAFALVCLSTATASATANYVYHEQTNNFVATPVDDPGGGCSGSGTDTSCGRYVENTDRSGSPGFQIYQPETYSLHFKVEFQFFTNQVRVYYTTDGSQPCGSFGTVGNVTQPNGTPCGAGNTTQVAVASYTCTYSDVSQSCQIVDVVTGSIPPQAAGTTVKYILSAWHSGGGDEIFANSGACGGCFAATSSSAATVFDYNVIAAPVTPLIISEFRLRGPGGADDEFVEIYNNSNSDVTVNAFDGSAGFALAASDGVTRFTIPNGTFIPARGHYLGVNSTGYSLGSYPGATTPASGGEEGATAGGPPTYAGGDAPTAKSRLRAKAAQRSTRTSVGAVPPGGETPPGPNVGVSGTPGDVTYTTGIADNAGIALFSTANPANFSLATRLDAAGSDTELNTLYVEGAGYPSITPVSTEHSFVRDLCGKGGSTSMTGTCPTGGAARDTGDNAADFIYVDTAATNAGAGEHLGAPGPENSTSPIQRNSAFPGSLIFPCVSSSAAPNRVRDYAAGPTATSPMGTLSIRRRITNNTGANVTRLRFRVIDISTFRAPTGTADLRVISSSITTVTSAENPCSAVPVLIQGTTLETPPTQSNGGGFNSSLSASTVTLLTPLTPGGTYDFQFTLGIKQTGTFKFYVNIEALP